MGRNDKKRFCEKIEMKVKENYSYLLNRLILSLHNFTGITVGLLILFIALRFGEYAIISTKHSGINKLFFYELSGLIYDLSFFFNCTSLIFFPIILLSIVFDFRVVNFLYTLIGAIFLMMYALLIYYFSETLNPLGSDFFSYSEEEIKLIIGASGAINIWILLIALLFIYIFFKVPALFRNINWHISVLITYLLISSLSWFYNPYIKPNINSYKKEINYFLSSNKLAYFFYNIKENKIQDSEIAYDGFYFDDDLTGKSFKYIDPENYPFLNIDTTQDVLSNYFNKSKNKPNLVFIIVEGLGRSYSGIDADNSSFTPYLDSLASHSLYWENFVSNGGRTFAVLPAIFASSPFGEKGILDYAENMPKQQSLIKLLTANGYLTSFYHGGKAHFDNMDIFLQRQNINRIIDDKNFPANYKKMPSSNQNFTWGYGDVELYNYYFKLIDTVKSPRVDILLTLSNHSPFKVIGLNKYREMFEERLVELGITGEGKELYSSYKDMYSCVLYTDDAIRNFVNNYKKRKDFANTIFIITGDHRMPEIPIDRRIDQFRVPLIIYSPMLKRKASFKGVSSHLDITPTLISYLRLNYRIKRPLQQAWLGADLDTSRFFISKKFIPMMRNKNELQDFIDRSIYSSGKKVGLINDRLITTNTNDLMAQRITDGRIKEFKAKNATIKNSKGLVPDSVFNYSVK